MTTMKLLSAIQDHVSQALVNYSYIAEDHNEYPVYVTCGFLKERELFDNPYRLERYALIRAIKGTITTDESTAIVRIIFSAKDTDVEDGYITVINMMEHVKQSILSRHFIGDKAFTYDRHITWVIDEEEAYPQYFGYLEVPFYIGNPHQIDADVYL